MNTTYKNIDEYISTFPADVQEILQKIRQTVHEAEPKAAETISYQMPTFNLSGKYLVYFGAWKNHIGFYPTPSGAKAFEKELKPYETSKGTAKFPLNKPIPYNIITAIVKFRAVEVKGK